MPLVGMVNTPILKDVAITSITIDRLNYDIKLNDKLKLVNYESGNTFDLTVDDEGTVGDTTITINSFTPTENIMSNNFIFFSVVRDSDHKLEIEH
jgi:hypothetical protein